MEGPAQVERLLQDQEGRKIGDLYIVKHDDSDEDSARAYSFHVD